MPKPKEIERKFVVENFSPRMIPEDVVVTSIVQDYLSDDGSGERRVRAKIVDGSMSYSFTKKKPTENLGERIELEHQISKEEYEELLRSKDPHSVTIRKTRYSFEYHKQPMELDIYEEPYAGLAVLEIEVADINNEIKIPEGWDVRDVTGNKKYSNHSLAQGLQ